MAGFPWMLPVIPEPRGPKPGWAPSNEERYERFLNTLLHGSDWSFGLKYFAIYWLRFMDEGRQLSSPLFENGSRKCAEAHLMEHLNLQLSVLDRDKLVEVTVMQNSSPCWGCSDRYEKDLGDIIRDSGITVTIVFSSFHRIRRRSCQWQHHLHVNTIPLEHHTLNRDGLKKMSKVGIILKTAQFQDWKVLRIALQLPDNIFEEAYNRSPRRKEDVLLKEDLDFILEN